MTTANTSPSANPPSHRMLTERQAADYCGFSFSTMRRLKATGEGPRCIRLSERRIAYRVTDLEAWLGSR